MWKVSAHPPEYGADILIMYCSSATTYGVRLKSCCPFVQDPRLVAKDGTGEPKAISFTEYDELSALRKAHAWGTPMFQPNHPRYEELMVRLKELEAKELAMAQRA